MAPAKITGNLKFTGDLKLAGMLHARFVLSTYAHANISGIDSSAALAVPGVQRVLTADDLPRGDAIIARQTHARPRSRDLRRAADRDGLGGYAGGGR